MFAAVTGALLAPSLEHAGTTVTEDDDDFTYWVSPTHPDEQEGDEHVQWLQRERVVHSDQRYNGIVDQYEEEQVEEVGQTRFRRAFGPHRQSKFHFVRAMDLI